MIGGLDPLRDVRANQCSNVMSQKSRQLAKNAARQETSEAVAGTYLI